MAANTHAIWEIDSLIEGDLQSVDETEARSFADTAVHVCTHDFYLVCIRRQP